MFPDLDKRVQSTLRSLHKPTERPKPLRRCKKVWDLLKVRELFFQGFLKAEEVARAERDLHSDVQTLHIPEMSHAV